MNKIYSLVYTFLGFTMVIWYCLIRWAWFVDHNIYWWAYEPINLATSFSSIVFLMTTTTLPNYFSKWLWSLGSFLALRNAYYTIVDIIDLSYNVAEQSIFIAIDVAMMVYCIMFLLKFKNKAL